ncbi:hypothetical protein DFH06DRAFT_1159558 [Mycena polygramma]|nr:hypothetical protein DFH06DRAFT_1159558 [Mycena polygramma]
MSTTSTTTVTLRSPNKPDKYVSAASGAEFYAATMALGDSSWDLADFSEENGRCVATRPPAEERPQARKVVLRGVRQQLEYATNVIADCEREREEDRRQRRRLSDHVRALSTHLLSTQAKVIQLAQAELNHNDPVELHEAVVLCLQAYSDIIFDTHRTKVASGRAVMDNATKNTLKRNKLGFLTQLLEPPETALKALDKDPELQKAQTKALDILSVAELRLCHELHGVFKAGREVRNAQQHPRPDRETVEQRIMPLLGPIDNPESTVLRKMLQALLNTNPRRLPYRSERDASGKVLPGTDLSIFAKKGEYQNAARSNGRKS